MNKYKFIVILFCFCCFYWLLDSAWSYLSFEDNISAMIFREPMSYLDTVLLQVPPYQAVARIMVVALFIASGSVIAFFFNKQKKAEKNIKEIHERFLTVLESIDTTIYVVDMDTHEILFMNDCMKKAFGGDLTGQTCWNAIRKEKQPCAHCIHSHLLNEKGEPEGIHVWEDENPVTGKWYINHDRAIRWVDGRIVRLQVAMDITDQKKLEAERRDYEVRIQQMQKMEAVGRIAGGVAHDFNNLLSVILGYNELILNKLPADHPQFNPLKEIHSASVRAQNLTRQLLAFGRKQVLEMKTVNLNTVVTGFEKLLRRMIGEDIELVLTLTTDSLNVEADSYQLEQVIMNLAVNARDAMPDGGRLDIETMSVELDESYASGKPDVEPGIYAMIAVSDTGNGIDQETMEHIFEPFYTTKDIEEGTGLGLATAYGIIKQHGGNVWVYSEPGRGTTFKVYLPISNKPYLEEVEKSEHSTPFTGTATILVVEDDPAVLQIVCEILLTGGYQVIEANNVEQAIEIAKKSKDSIHLLITDVIMPGMKGPEVYQKVYAHHPAMKVLYMSGYTDNVIARHGVLEDGIQFIQKPLSVKGLIGKVDQILRK